MLELAGYFLERHRTFRSLSLSTAASDALLTYDWPGNVRELERVIERAVALAGGPFLQFDDLPPRLEVYVTQFPSGRGKWQVSRQGGIVPTWRRDGREIFFLSPDHHTLFAAEVTARGEDFRVTNVQNLFTTGAVAGVGYPYDVSADGNRFLFVTGFEETSSPLTLVVNWTALLAR